MAILERAVAASLDDAYFSRVNTAYNGTYPYAYFGAYSASSKDFGVITRFLNIPILKDSIIEEVRIGYRAYATKSGLGCYTRFRGELAANSAAFSSRAEIIAKPLTAAEVLWTPPAFIKPGWYPSPNLAAIVQEIVNQPGWVSGNAISIMVEDYGSLTTPTGANFRYISTYDENTTYAPTIMITYTGPPVDLGMEGVVELTGSVAADIIGPTYIDAEINSTIELTGAVEASIRNSQEAEFEGTIELTGSVAADTIGPVYVNAEISGNIEATGTVEADSIVAPDWWIATEAIVEATPERVRAIVGVERNGTWYYSEESDTAIAWGEPDFRSASVAKVGENIEYAVTIWNVRVDDTYVAEYRVGVGGWQTTALTKSGDVFTASVPFSVAVDDVAFRARVTRDEVDYLSDETILRVCAAMELPIYGGQIPTYLYFLDVCDLAMQTPDAVEVLKYLSVADIPISMPDAKGNIYLLEQADLPFHPISPDDHGIPASQDWVVGIPIG